MARRMAMNTGKCAYCAIEYTDEKQYKPCTMGELWNLEEMRK